MHGSRMQYQASFSRLLKSNLPNIKEISPVRMFHFELNTSIKKCVLLVTVPNNLSLVTASIALRKTLEEIMYSCSWWKIECSRPPTLYFLRYFTCWRTALLLVLFRSIKIRIVPIVSEALRERLVEANSYHMPSSCFSSWLLVVVNSIEVISL